MQFQSNRSKISCRKVLYRRDRAHRHRAAPTLVCSQTTTAFESSGYRRETEFTARLPANPINAFNSTRYRTTALVQLYCIVVHVHKVTSRIGPTRNRSRNLDFESVLSACYARTPSRHRYRRNHFVRKGTNKLPLQYGQLTLKTPSADRMEPVSLIWRFRTVPSLRYCQVHFQLNGGGFWAFLSAVIFSVIRHFSAI